MAEEMRVVSVGSDRKVLFEPEGSPSSPDQSFDRQVRAFGADSQHAIQQLRVAIVGLGGTGSIIAQQLVHLGVRDFILVDPDVIDLTNLNRVANASSSDVGHAKVDVAERYLQLVAPSVRAKKVKGDVLRSKIANELTDADIIFGCTDSHGSRAVIQQVAYQYLIPCIDMGTTIHVNTGRIAHVIGRVQLLAPGLACLTCSGLLDSNEVRRDMMTTYERQQDPYIPGAREPAPAVMSLNGTVASLAVTMFLATVAGVPSTGRHLLYNAMGSTLRAVRVVPHPTCYVCSRSGSLARGDAWPIFSRQD